MGHGQVLGFGGLRPPGYRRGRRSKDVGLHALGGRWRQGHGHPDVCLHEFADLGVDRVELLAEAGVGELLAVARQRIGGEDRLGLTRLHVIAGVVGGVAAEPEGVGLDQKRLGGCPGLGNGGAELEHYLLGIAAVDGETLHAVAAGPLPQRTGYELLVNGGRVGVAVVLDDEQDRQPQQGREVHGLVHVAGGTGAVAEESEADRRLAQPALRIDAADDVREHDAEMGDHRQAAVGGIAVVDVALARLGRAAAVGEVLAKMVAELSAPDQVTAKSPMGERDDVNRLVGQQGQRTDQGFIALATGHRAADESLSEKVEDAVVPGAGELHPGVQAQARFLPLGGLVLRPEVAAPQDRWGRGEAHL